MLRRIRLTRSGPRDIPHPHTVAPASVRQGSKDRHQFCPHNIALLLPSPPSQCCQRHHVTTNIRCSGSQADHAGRAGYVVRVYHTTTLRSPEEELPSHDNAPFSTLRRIEKKLASMVVLVAPGTALGVSVPGTWDRRSCLPREQRKFNLSGCASLRGEAKSVGLKPVSGAYR